jgi:hypothetical protein
MLSHSLTCLRMNAATVALVLAFSHTALAATDSSSSPFPGLESVNSKSLDKLSAVQTSMLLNTPRFGLASLRLSSARTGTPATTAPLVFPPRS